MSPIITRIRLQYTDNLCLPDDYPVTRRDGQAQHRFTLLFEIAVFDTAISAYQLFAAEANNDPPALTNRARRQRARSSFHQLNQ